MIRIGLFGWLVLFDSWVILAESLAGDLTAKGEELFGRFGLFFGLVSSVIFILFSKLV